MAEEPDIVQQSNGFRDGAVRVYWAGVGQLGQRGLRVASARPETSVVIRRLDSGVRHGGEAIPARTHLCTGWNTAIA